MPKMKTKRSAAKRFKVTASGKLKRGHSHRNHKFTSKSGKRKRHLRNSGQIADADAGRVRRMLGLKRRKPPRPAVETSEPAEQ